MVPPSREWDKMMVIPVKTRIRINLTQGDSSELIESLFFVLRSSFFPTLSQKEKHQASIYYGGKALRKFRRFNPLYLCNEEGFVNKEMDESYDIHNICINFLRNILNR